MGKQHCLILSTTNKAAAESPRLQLSTEPFGAEALDREKRQQTFLWGRPECSFVQKRPKWWGKEKKIKDQGQFSMLQVWLGWLMEICSPWHPAGCKIQGTVMPGFVARAEPVSQAPGLFFPSLPVTSEESANLHWLLFPWWTSGCLRLDLFIYLGSKLSISLDAALSVLPRLVLWCCHSLA